MWCPEGYISLSEIRANLEAELEARGAKPDTVLPLDSRCAWLMAGFIDRYKSDIGVAPLTGGVVRPDSRLLNRHDEGTYGGDFDLESYLEFPAEHIAALKPGEWPFSFIDYLTMTLYGKTIDGSGLGYAACPLGGLPLCIESPKLPKTTSELVDLLEGFCAPQPLRAPPRAFRRLVPKKEPKKEPSEEPKKKYPEAYDAIMTAYPEGKGAATWAEVEKRVGYGRRQIRRVLEEYELKEWWGTGRVEAPPDSPGAGHEPK